MECLSVILCVFDFSSFQTILAFWPVTSKKLQIPSNRQPSSCLARIGDLQKNPIE